jgi:AcrR family transcriptional regulator
MPRTKEQFRKIREIKRKHIMDSALEVFAEKGFAATSMNMIAIKADISKGLTYNYFKSKEELITTIIIDGFDKFGEVFDRNKDGVITHEELVFFIDKTFEILQSNINFWKLYFMLVMQADVLKLVESKLMELSIPIFTSLQLYYHDKGIENPVAYARFIVATLDGICLNYVIDPEGFPVEEIKKLIINKIL